MQKPISAVGAILIIFAVFGIGSIAVAYRAGVQFQDSMELLNNQPLGTPSMRLTDTQVDRGWFESKATADLQIAVTGQKPMTIPVILHTTQGFNKFDGSAMHVRVQTGIPSDSALAALLGAAHDPNPVTADIAVNLAGEPTHIALTFAPMTASLPLNADSSLSFNWGGGHADVNVDGLFSPQGGSMHGTYNLLPWSLRVPQQALHVDMGPFTETFQENGKPGNLHGHVNVTIGPSGMTRIGTDHGFQVEQITMQSDFAVRQPDNAMPGNPSGLQNAGFSLTGMQLAAQLSKPAGGLTTLTGNVGFTATPQEVLAVSSGDIEALRTAILKNLQARLQLRVARTLLMRMPPQELGQLEKTGYLRTNGADDEVDMTIKNGAVSINGHPILPKPQNLASTPGLNDSTISPSAPSPAATASEPSEHYATRLARLIRQNIIAPQTSRFSGNAAVGIAVTLNPETGQVLRVAIMHPSGDSAWDNAVVLAVNRMGSFPADRSGKWYSPIDIQASPDEVSGLQSAAALPTPPRNAPVNPIQFGAASIANAPLDATGNVRSVEYQQRIARLVAMRMHALRAARERSLFEQTGHAVALPTGQCAVEVNVEPNGFVRQMQLAACDSPALGEVEMQAIDESSPLPPPGFLTHIRVAINAPLATPGISP